MLHVQHKIILQWWGVFGLPIAGIIDNNCTFGRLESIETTNPQNGIEIYRVRLLKQETIDL